MEVQSGHVSVSFRNSDLKELWCGCVLTSFDFDQFLLRRERSGLAFLQCTQELGRLMDCRVCLQRRLPLLQTGSRVRTTLDAKTNEHVETHGIN
jgi:hypothetical protein